MSQTSPLPATMRAIRFERGDAVRVVLDEMPLPEVASGEVLIRVAYAGLNRADVLQRDGRYPPPAGAPDVPGLEVSGWRVDTGEEVCALLGGGGYAEYVAAPAGQVLPLPKGIDLKQAATLPEAAATGVMALGLETHLKAGERLLIHGGTSGLGLMLTQMAKAWSAEVFATVGSDEKVTFLKEFGIRAVNHRTRNFAEQVMELTNNEGVDVIVDTLGAPQFSAHLGLLRAGGRMVTLAMMEGATAESVKLGRLLTHRLHVSGTMLRSRSAAEKAEIMARVRETVWPHLATGAIKPVIAEVFPLAEAEKALKRMEERLHLGKILLEGTSK